MLLKSSTAMTLAAMISKSAIVLIITPLIALTLDSNDLVVWFLYLSAISLVRMLDFGLSPTFIRVTSYLQPGQSKDNGLKLDKLTYSNVYLFTRSKFKKMATIACLLGLSIGTLLVYSPISSSSKPHWFLFGWLVVVLISSYSLYSNYILCYCLGKENVAKVQQIQVKANLIAGILSTISFIAFNDIVVSCVLYMASFPLSVIGLKRNFLINFSGECEQSSLPILKDLTRAQSIKSGVGLLLSTGLIEFSGVVGANLLTSSAASKYQFGLQLIRAVNGFSHAPFTSKIPKMSRLFVNNDYDRLLKQCRNSMRKSYLLFFTGYSVIFFGLNILFYLDVSISSAPSRELWFLLGLCFLVERVGSLHIQLYSLTNNIIWHKVNAASGFLTVLLCFIIYSIEFLPPEYIFPVSMTIAYMFTYVPMSLLSSSGFFDFNPIKFELRISMPYFLITSLYSLTFVDY